MLKKNYYLKKFNLNSYLYLKSYYILKLYTFLEEYIFISLERILFMK